MAAILGALRLGLQHPKPGALPGAHIKARALHLVRAHRLARLQLPLVRAWRALGPRVLPGGEPRG
jgi:hypothetical protein